MAERAGQIYGIRKPEEKQYLANFVFSNLSLMEKKLQFSFHLIFDAIKKYQKDKNELALLNTFRTYEWTYPYQPLDYSFKYMQQILYQEVV